MKKLIALVLTLFLLSSAAFAEGALSRSAQDDLLIARAQASAEKLVALCGIEGYAEYFVGLQEVQNVLEDWIEDWPVGGAPERTAIAFISIDDFALVYKAVIRLSGTSEELKDYADFAMRTLSTMPATLINGKYGGTTMLAASSAARYSELCALDGLAPGVAMVLSDYGEDRPLILTSICIEPDGASLISSAFLIHSPIDEAVFAMAGGSVSFSDMLDELFEGADGDIEKDAAALMTTALYALHFDLRTGSGEAAE